MVDLVAIQAEQIAWSERNFGKQHERYPLLGMIEEILEFDSAWKDMDVACTFDTPPVSEWEKLQANILDAVGDIAIYMLDYCGKRGLELNSLWVERLFLDDKMSRNWHDLTPLARRLAHHQLKGEQGIRGTPEHHLREIDMTCRAVLAHLEVICKSMRKDFLEILDGVWSKVRQRDWTKNPVNAHEVAEVAT